MGPSISPSPSYRAKKLKAEFIEVYSGSLEFETAGLNCIILIFLQAANRIYEIILLRRDPAEEMNRFYIYENDLNDHMDMRRSALMASPEVIEEEGLKRRVSVSDRRKSSISVRSDSKNDTDKDDELKKLLNSKQGKSRAVTTKEGRSFNPVTYFGLEAPCRITPEPKEEHKKVDVKAIYENQSLIDTDICACEVRDISFYTAVILTSLYVRLKSRQQTDHSNRVEHLLYDGMLAKNAYICSVD